MRRFWWLIVLLVFVLVFFAYFGLFYPVKYKAIVEIYANKYGLPHELVFAVINTESHFKPDAKSHMGAVGLMQIMEPTGIEVSKKLGIENNLTDAEININIGCYYLRFLLNRYEQNVVFALSAYNAGYGNVDDWISKGFDGKIEDIPIKETKNYVKKVKNAEKIYKLMLLL